MITFKNLSTGYHANFEHKMVIAPNGFGGYMVCAINEDGTVGADLLDGVDFQYLAEAKTAARALVNA